MLDDIDELWWPSVVDVHPIIIFFYDSSNKSIERLTGYFANS